MFDCENTGDRAGPLGEGFQGFVDIGFVKTGFVNIGFVWDLVEHWVCMGPGLVLLMGAISIFHSRWPLPS